MKPESRLWQSVREKMWCVGDRLDRVENSVASGQPDVNGCLAGEDVWIELKAPTEPKRDSTPLMTSNGNHELLISQQNWFKRQEQAGGIAFVLIRTDKRLLLIDGTKYATGEHFNKYPVPQMVKIALFHAAVPTKAEEWRLLRNVIFTASRYRRLHQHASAQLMLNDLERDKGRVAGDRVPGGGSAMAPGEGAAPRASRGDGSPRKRR